MGGPAIVVDGGKGVLINLISYSKNEEKIKRFVFKPKARCFLNFGTTDFLGNTTYPQKEIECEEIKSFVDPSRP
jgi:hypothetical protein